MQHCHGFSLFNRSGTQQMSTLLQHRPIEPASYCLRVVHRPVNVASILVGVFAADEAPPLLGRTFKHRIVLDLAGVEQHLDQSESVRDIHDELPDQRVRESQEQLCIWAISTWPSKYINCTGTKAKCVCAMCTCPSRSSRRRDFFFLRATFMAVGSVEHPLHHG